METTHWLIEPINEWKQLRGGFNWYSFTLIYIMFEKENIAHGYEFWFTLLGLGFYIRYNTDKSNEQFEQWNEEAKDAKPWKSLEELD